MRKILFASIPVLLFLAWSAFRIVAAVQFDQNAEGHLKRAADANTIELAQQELDTTLKYLEENNLTSGYTSILYNTPDEDIAFWYTNLKSSLKKLSGVSSQASELEKTNVLIKLQETLLDQGRETRVTVPAGISIYPLNRIACLLGIFIFILLIHEAITIYIKYDRDFKKGNNLLPRGPFSLN